MRHAAKSKVVLLPADMAGSQNHVFNTPSKRDIQEWDPDTFDEIIECSTNLFGIFTKSQRWGLSQQGFRIDSIAKKGGRKGGELFSSTGNEWPNYNQCAIGLWASFFLLGVVHTTSWASMGSQVWK